MAQGLNKQQVDWVERTFQLAFFIVRNRQGAIETVRRALDRFDLQSRRERKRAYWRRKHLRQWVTRASKVDSDILQWLTYAEASPYEKQQEESGEINPEVMVVRYIKCLVEAATTLSSFHLNVGLQRVLRNYSTLETQQVYELVTDRHLGADEYRRAKRLLMGKLQARFGSMLRTTECPYGEIRFVARSDQDCCTEIVDQCLEEFIPWSTQGACVVPPQFHPAQDVLPRFLSGAGAGKADYSIIEVNRFHAFLDPVCFSRLAKAAGLDSPEQRLSVPEFFHQNGKNKNKSGDVGKGPHAPPLSDEERVVIRKYLAEQDLRRQGISVRILRIAVNGEECWRARLDEDWQRQFDIEDGAKLIEIWTQHDGEELLLSSHRVLYSPKQDFLSFDGPVFASQGRSLALRISPQTGDGAELRHATATLTCRPKDPITFGRSWGPRSWLALLPKYAFLAILLMATGWWIASGWYQRQDAVQRAEWKRLQKELISQRALRRGPAGNEAVLATPGAIASYTLVSDSLGGRETGNSEIVKVPVPKQGLIILALPIDNLVDHPYRAVLQGFFDHSEILTERLSRSTEPAKNSILEFQVPASLLEPGRQYAVQVMFLRPGLQSQDVDSFTFKAVERRESKP